MVSVTNVNLLEMSEEKSFYGMYIKQDAQNDKENCHVFTNQREAFRMMKTLTKARLKEFKTYEDAENFSKTGFVNTFLNPSVSPQLFVEADATMNHELIFHGPNIQQLIKFRKSIETGKSDDVREKIWNNPRYLIGVGGAPTILKESTRYNALHVAVLSNNSKICEMILKTLIDPSYIDMFIGKNNSQSCEEVSGILLDFYLNMPEKGRLETPLHLAAKYGYIDIVKVLISYTQSIYRRNSQGKYPKDIICSRCPESMDTSEVAGQIFELLDVKF